ncbi:MAG TPA: PepSY domain-containing protein [Candidatus Acidoferrum sp.]|nr:PepSY domain-containing protein [Candidatus Acidoferrum sp.]
MKKTALKKTLIRALVAGFLVVGLCVSAGAQTQTPKKSKIPAALKKDAKISVEDARATALKKVPGEILEEELEKENGKLVYSFDIRVTGQKDITEVQVSAIDGSIVSVEKENAASEAKEKKQDSGKP